MKVFKTLGSRILEGRHGFSFIEAVLFIALSGVVFVLMLGAMSTRLYLKNLDLNKIISPSKSTSSSSSDSGSGGYFLERGLQINYSEDSGNFLLAYKPTDLIGRKFCRIRKAFSGYSVISPPIVNLNNFNLGEVTGLKIEGNNIIASFNSATSSNSDFAIIDLSDKNNWKVLSALNTGPGLAGLNIQGHYAFLANTSVNAQFQVVDFRNPSIPIIFPSLKIPQSISLNSKKNPAITSISSDQSGLIYLGSQKSDLGEVFTAQFNGRSLSYKKSIDTGSVVNDLVADANGVWITSPSDNELIHYNLSGTIDRSFNAIGQSGNGKRIDMLGDKIIILGRTYGGQELVQIDGPSKKVSASVDDIILAHDEAGMINAVMLLRVGGASKLEVWKINIEDNASGTASMALDSKIIEVPLPIVANRFACNGDQFILGTASSTEPFIIVNGQEN